MRLVVRHEDDKVENIGTWHDSPYREYRDICFSARLYTSKYNKADRPYNHYTSLFFDDYHPQLEDMERGVKAMRKITQKMAAMNAKRGYAVDAIEEIGRFAEAVSADCMVERLSKTSDFFYSDMKHRFHTIGEGINTLRYMVKNDAEWQQGLTKAMEREAA